VMHTESTKMALEFFFWGPFPRPQLNLLTLV